MSPVLDVLAQTPTPTPTPTPPAADPATSLATPEIDWVALAPLLVLGLGAVLLLTVTSLLRRRGGLGGLYAVWTVLVAGGAAAATIPLWHRVVDDGASTVIGGALGVDGFGLFVVGLICLAVALTALVSDGYLRREGLEGPELYVLMLLAATGGAVMAMANDLIVLFLGLETLSIAAYVLAAMHLKRIESQEAGMKYFVLGAFSSAFFLYGIAFVYGATGSTNLVRINAFLAANLPADSGLLVLGLGLMLVGLGFKVAAVPFHAWTPDVYQGSPTPVVAFMASGIKAAGFAALIRVFVLTFETYRLDWQPVIYALAVLSLLVGAGLAIVQSDVKRMLAYSSINHAGFILVGVQLASDEGTAAVLFYLAAYTVMVTGSFAIVTLVSRTGDRRSELGDYRGLGRSHPALAFFLTVFLLAQAGVPFTVGFDAKLFIVSAAADGGEYVLAVIAMVSAVIAAFLYLRIVATMFSGGDEVEEADAEAVDVPTGAGLVVGACFVLTIFFGLFPGALDDWTDHGVPELVEYEQPDTAGPPEGLPLDQLEQQQQP